MAALAVNPDRGGAPVLVGLAVPVADLVVDLAVHSAATVSLGPTKLERVALGRRDLVGRGLAGRGLAGRGLVLLDLALVNRLLRGHHAEPALILLAIATH